MRNGVDARLPLGALDCKAPTRALTHTEMLRQIARDYPGLPDARTLTFAEIVWFYDGLRPELKKQTKNGR